MLCAISGEAPQQPVFSNKTGHIYEKRLIEKYINESQKCPITGEPMQLQDLSPVNLTNKISKPRVSSANSIPSMLLQFQNEWDTVVLEAFHLKQECHQLKVELAQALYENEAAKRVIANLLKERGNAVATSSSASPVKTKAPSPVKAPPTEMQVDQPLLLDAETVAKIEKTSLELSQKRRKRKASETLATADQIKDYSLQTLLSNSKSGIVSIDSHQDLIVAGNKKGSLLVFQNGEQVALDAHKKDLTSIKLVNGSILTSGIDGFIKKYSKSNEEWSLEKSLKISSGESVSLVSHPVQDLVIAYYGSTWNVVDFANFSVILSSETSNQITACHVHPDGVLVALGLANGSIEIIDLKTLEKAATFEQNSAIKSLDFSENGYYLASATSHELQVWDLRKLASVHSVQIELYDVKFDYSGQYLLCLLANGQIQLFLNKQWTLVASFDVKSATCFSIGQDCKFIAVGCSNGKIQLIE